MQSNQEMYELFKWMRLCLLHSHLEFEAVSLLRDVLVNDLKFTVNNIKITFLNTKVRKAEIDILFHNIPVQIVMTTNV